MKYVILLLMSVSLSYTYGATKKYEADENHLPHAQKQEEQEDPAKMKIPGYRWYKVEEGFETRTKTNDKESTTTSKINKN